MTHEEYEIEFERLQSELDQVRSTLASEEGSQDLLFLKLMLLEGRIRQLRVEQAKLPLPTLPIDSLGEDL